MSTAAHQSGSARRRPGRDTGPSCADLARLFERVPPHALEAEAALLGAMILDSQAIGDVLQVVGGSDDFYKPAHAAVYQALVDLYDQNQPVDMVHLKQALADRQQLEQVGGLDYLLMLSESVPTVVAAPHYASLVRDKAVLRRLIETAGTILQQAYTSSEPVGNLLDIAERAIFQLAEKRSSTEAASLGQLLEDAWARLDAHDGGGLTGLATGFTDLDEMTCGLQAGDMIVIAARPSMGKTAIATGIAEHIAADLHQPVAVFSLEMSKELLADRLLCSRSGVDSHRLRRRMLSDVDFGKLQDASSVLSEAPLFIDDTPGLQVLALRAKARRLASRHHIKAIVIDYLQLMSAPGAESRQQEVSLLSRSVKELARELSVPVICLSQLNRAAESREGHRPRMSDLRESGSIEQDADVVLLLHREEYYHQDDPAWVQGHPEEVGVAELIVAKQRNGPTGTVRLHFDRASTRFSSLARSHAGAGGWG